MYAIYHITTGEFITYCGQTIVFEFSEYARTLLIYLFTTGNSAVKDSEFCEFDITTIHDITNGHFLTKDALNRLIGK
jgi:hypothetical protein